jgi:hypothetical protein
VSTIFRIAAASTLLVALACHHSAKVAARPSPADSLAALAAQRPACTVPVAITAGKRWPLGELSLPDALKTDTARTIAVRLPDSFQPTATRHPERRRWASPDSTAIELWLSDTPVTSVGGTGVAQFGGETACTMALGGHAPALVVRYWMILTGRRDTLYNAATSAIIGPNQAVDAVISSRARAGRDSLLAVLANLELPVAGPPRPTPGR